MTFWEKVDATHEAEYIQYAQSKVSPLTLILVILTGSSTVLLLKAAAPVQM